MSQVLVPEVFKVDLGQVDVRDEGVPEILPEVVHGFHRRRRRRGLSP